MSNEWELKLEKIRLLEQRKKLKEDLPHLYGFKYYKWQRQHIESTNYYTFLKAGNQLGKSICNGIKWVTWATEPSMWKSLWTKRPRQFWVLMPTRDIINTEFKEKWEPEFLPSKKYSDHPQYGWQAEIKNRNLWAIHFNSGISVYMHTYEQDVHHLQAGTVDAMFVDEELPYDLYPELNMRLQAVSGYFNMVYTPTRGEIEWMNLWKEGRKESFKEAFKQEVSLMDCLEYEDGSKSHWTEEKINRVFNSLGTESEIQLRVHGKNTKPEGLKIPAFDPDRNVRPPIEIPKDWVWYSGIDIGTGGEKNHPAAISFIAVKPDLTKGRVVRCWRGPKGLVTGHGDIVDQWFKMKEELQIKGDLEGVYYDWQAKDFQLTATSRGLPLLKAEKSHEVGFPLLNTLFKNNMLIIEDTEENGDFVDEAMSLRTRIAKTVAKDDAVDSVRYGISKIPWDMSKISVKEIIDIVERNVSVEDQRRRGQDFDSEKEDAWDCSEEINNWNEVFDI